MKKKKNTVHPSEGIIDVVYDRKFWKQLAEKYNGDFLVKYTKDRQYESHITTIPYKKWLFQLLSSDTRPLRVEAIFFTMQDFSINISWEDFLTKIFKKIGRKEVEYGWYDFDKQYYIETSDRNIARKLVTIDVQKTLVKHNLYSLIFDNNRKTREATLKIGISRQLENAASVDDVIKMTFRIIERLNELNIIK